MALRYMNLLKGAPRCVAKDWMNETRILLETQQAVDTLIAYAGSMGLVYLGGGDSKVNIHDSAGPSRPNTTEKSHIQE